MKGLTNHATSLLWVCLMVLGLLCSFQGFGQVKITSIVTTESRCLSSGSMSISASNGIGPLQFALVPPSVITRGLQLDSVFGALSPGTYKVQVQDSLGNIDTLPVVIRGTYAVQSMSVNTTDAICKLPTGKARIIIDTNGRVPFDYRITSGPKLTGWSRSPFFDSLSTGSYVVSVRDSCNNIRTVGFQIKDTNTGTVARLITHMGLTCDSVQIRVSASGGISPYNFTLSLDTGDIMFSTNKAHDPRLFWLPKNVIYSVKVTDQCKDSSVFNAVKTADPVLYYTLSQNCDSMSINLYPIQSGTNLFGSRCLKYGLQEQGQPLKWQSRPNFRGKDTTKYTGYLVDTCCKDTISVSFTTKYPPFKIDTIRPLVIQQGFLDSTATLYFYFPIGAKYDAKLLSYSHGNKDFTTTGVQQTSNQLNFAIKPNDIIRKGAIGSMSILNVPEGTYTFVFESLNPCGLDDTITLVVKNKDLWRYPVYINGSNRCPGFHALLYGSTSYSLSYSRLTIFDQIRGKHLLLGADSSIVGAKKDSILYLKEGGYILEHKFIAYNPVQMVNVNYPLKYRDTVQLKDPGFPSITGLATYGCKDSSISIFANAELGLKPYKFRIKRSADSTWSTYKDSSSFLNLLTNSYDVEVSDRCGNFTVSSTSSGLAITPQIKLAYSCVGDTIKLKSSEFYGMNYSWKRVRDNAVISNSHECSIYPFVLQDQGMYSLTASLPSGGKVCNDTTAELYLGERFKYTYEHLDGCDSIQLGAQRAFNTGESRDTFVSAIGCDSVVIRSHYVGKRMDLTIDTAVCDSFYFKNKWYANTGTYKDSITGIGLIIDTLTYTGFESTPSNYGLTGSSIVTTGAYSGLSSLEFDAQTDILEMPVVNKPSELHYFYRNQDADKGYPRMKVQYKQTGAWIDLTSIEHSSDTFRHIVINLSPISHLNNITLRIVQESYQPSVTFLPYLLDDILITRKTMSCDTVWQLDVTINDTKHELTDLTDCDSIFHNGSWFHADTILPDTLVSSVGCDSIHTVQLWVPHSYERLDTVQGCDSAYHTSTWYKHGELRSDTFTSVSNCDSIVHTYFNLGNTVHNTIELAGCDSLFVDDQWFKQSIVHLDTISGSNSCDSIITYSLEIHPSYNDTFQMSACDSFSYQTSKYYVSGMIKTTHLSQWFCDSVSTIDLTISKSSLSYEFDTICRNDTILLPNGTSSKPQSSNTYIYTYANQFQCDSVVNRFVTVHECPLCPIYFPNAISTNGDLVNERFKQVSNCSFAYYQLRIYNRWGALIYETDDPDAAWDGYVMDKKAPMTAYLYIANYLLNQPGATPTQQAGTVTVLR